MFHSYLRLILLFKTNTLKSETEAVCVSVCPYQLVSLTEGDLVGLFLWRTSTISIYNVFFFGLISSPGMNPPVSFLWAVSLSHLLRT